MGFFEIVGHTGFWIAAAVALLAGFMRGFVGVGSGMLMAPVFAILFGPLQTVGMVIMLDALVTAQLLPSVHRLIEWRVIIPMAAMAALFMPVGTWLLLTVDARSMARAIAVHRAGFRDVAHDRLALPRPQTAAASPSGSAAFPGS